MEISRYNGCFLPKWLHARIPSPIWRLTVTQQREHVNLVVDEEVRPDFEHRIETDPVAGFEGARELPTAVISLELYEDGGV